MDKGIIIGAEHEAATRISLPFVMFRHATSVSRTMFLQTTIRSINTISRIYFCITSCSIIFNFSKSLRQRYLLPITRTWFSLPTHWRSYSTLWSSPALALMWTIIITAKRFCSPTQSNSWIILMQRWMLSSVVLAKLKWPDGRVFSILLVTQKRSLRCVPHVINK